MTQGNGPMQGRIVPRHEGVYVGGADSPAEVAQRNEDKVVTEDGWVVERNVPIPQRNLNQRFRRRLTYDYPFSDLGPGDSFYVEAVNSGAMRKLASKIRAQGTRYRKNVNRNFKLAIRTHESGSSARVWRVA